MATDPTSTVPPKRTSSVGFDVVRIALAVVLLAAAALKGYQLATEPVANKDLFSYRWSLALQTEFELFLGLWLLSGLCRRFLWLVALACFLFFCGVTLYKALSGEVSCGCFGQVSVNPWYTLILDVGCAVALAVFRPNLRQPQPVRHGAARLLVAAVLLLAIGGPLGVAMATYTPGLELLEPEGWVGQPLAILREIDIGDRLAKGRWLVILHRYDCPHCREARPELERLARDFPKLAPGVGVAMVEVPPYGKPQDDAASLCLQGRLNTSRDWFVTTPVILVLDDRQVTAVWQEKVPEEIVILDAALAPPDLQAPPSPSPVHPATD
jgi:hypothetical protein